MIDKRPTILDMGEAWRALNPNEALQDGLMGTAGQVFDWDKGVQRPRPRPVPPTPQPPQPPRP